MERLVGETLADRVASERGLPFDDVVDILIQVLSALIAAHGQRILHRDIKPENVFLTARVGCPPLVKLLDFGVSKVMGDAPDARDDLRLTRTGMVMGTPYYMAPEQARGERDIDARVDLYACGVIMYESLTGKRPFTADNYNALLMQILSGTPRPASDLRPALPAAYAAVIEKAMARRRDDRYPNALEFQRDLQRLRDRQGASFARPRPERSPDAGSERRARAAEVVSSSVEIPISEASETGLFPVEPTEVTPRERDLGAAAGSRRPGDSVRGGAGESDEDTTQLMAPGKPRQR
jgi:serine/threonine protein kinase